MGDVPLVLQTASVTGMWGVEFLVLLVPSAVAAVLTSAVRATTRVRVGALAVVVLAAALGGDALRLAGEQGPVQRVAAIATNQRVWAPDLATPAGRDLAAAYANQITDLPEGVRTVVLPEQSFRSTEARPAALVEPMSRVARKRGIDIVVGFAHWDHDVKYNYALIFLARGGDPVVYLNTTTRSAHPATSWSFRPSPEHAPASRSASTSTSPSRPGTTRRPAPNCSWSQPPTRTTTAGSAAGWRCCGAWRTDSRSCGR